MMSLESGKICLVQGNTTNMFKNNLDHSLFQQCFQYSTGTCPPAGCFTVFTSNCVYFWWSYFTVLLKIFSPLGQDRPPSVDVTVCVIWISRYHIFWLIRCCILGDSSWFWKEIFKWGKKKLPDIQSFSLKNTLTIHYLHSALIISHYFH